MDANFAGPAAEVAPTSCSWRLIGLAFAIVAASCLSTAAQATPHHDGPTKAKARFSAITYNKGDVYFTVNGWQRPVAMRNISSNRIEDLQALLDDSKVAGTKLVRIHVRHGFGFGITSNGAVDPAWLAVWDSVFDLARRRGISVIPVFGVWADWNNSSPIFANWHRNPLNVVNGGPAQSPSELLQPGSAAQTLWLAWMDGLVRHWQRRDNIVGWEVFSELDLVTGSSEPLGTAFAAAGAAIIRAGDARGRPVLASSVSEWPMLNSSDAVDILQVHVYREKLDIAILQAVIGLRSRYGKPVLIGESGLSALPPDFPGGTPTTAPGAPIGIKHAIWAGMLSGSMSFRSLWFEDGYGIYHPTVGLPFVQSYRNAEAGATRFLRRTPASFARFAPLEANTSDTLVAVTLGDSGAVLGWARDAGCTAPAYNCSTMISGQSITINVPGATGLWRVDFFDTATGSRRSATQIEAQNGVLVFTFPDFVDDVAFRLLACTHKGRGGCRR